MRPPCGLREPHEKLARSAPLLFGERVGARGNIRPPCGLREPHEKMARSAPSPLWGEGWGEGNMRLRWWFRSLYVLHFSFSRITRERARGARRLPPGYPGSRQRKSPLRGDPQLIPSGFRVGHQPASMQAMPSRRVPAPRPGLPETLRRFSAGQGSRCKSFKIL